MQSPASACAGLCIAVQETACLICTNAHLRYTLGKATQANSGLLMPVMGLYDAVRRKAYRKRTDGRLTWTLGLCEDLPLSVLSLGSHAESM